MKILLASDGNFVLKYGYKMLGIPADKIHIGYVTTASKVTDSKSFFDAYKEKMKVAGYSYEEIDIEGKNKEELLKFFADKNVIHIEGGNTFYLLKVIRETGFGEILKELLEKGLCYVGTSAGAYIMCPTIEVAAWRKDKEEEWYGLKDFSALNYVPFVLKVHYKDEMAELVKEKIKTLKYPLRILRDGQGIFVDNNKFTFAGDGEEVKLK